MKLKKITGWKYGVGNKSLRLEFKCKDFISAVRLITRIARLAEKMDHHPDLHLTGYRKLKVVLRTHSAGRVTAKDLLMAAFINKIKQG